MRGRQLWCQPITASVLPLANSMTPVPLEANSDDFVFDNQMLAQILWSGSIIAEVSCPTRYFEEASSIDFGRSVHYGLGCLRTSAEYFAARRGWLRSPRFPVEIADVLRDE